MSIKIRVRFVQALQTKTPIYTDQQIEAALKRANRNWTNTGIQFQTRSKEAYEMPNLHAYAGPNIAWQAIRDELRQVFPHMPVDAYLDSDAKTPAGWLFAATALYGDPSEILVWLLDDQNGKSGANLPWKGRFLYIKKPQLWNYPLDIPSTTLSHEFGHFLGLYHTDNSKLPPGYMHCNRWNEIFVPGPPPQFPTSKDDSTCAASAIKYIAKAANSTITATNQYGPINVTVNGTTFSAGGSSIAPEIRGLFRETGHPHNPPKSWGFALNLMGGIPYDGSIKPHGSIPRFLSESQIATATDFLNRDVNYGESVLQILYTGNNKLPKGAMNDGTTSLRSRLNMSSFQHTITKYSTFILDKQRVFNFAGKGARYPDARIELLTTDETIFNVWFLPDNEPLVEHYEPKSFRRNIFLKSRQFPWCVDILRNEGPHYIRYNGSDCTLLTGREVPGAND